MIKILTQLGPMVCSTKFNTVLSQESPFYKLKGHRLQLKKKVFLSLKIDLVWAKSEDPDEMPPSLFAKVSNLEYLILRVKKNI